MVAGKKTPASFPSDGLSSSWKACKISCGAKGPGTILDIAALVAAASPLLTVDQVFPPSVVFNTPCREVAAYTTFEFDGFTTIVFTGKCSNSLVASQVTPLSRDRNIPPPSRPTKR